MPTEALACARGQRGHTEIRGGRRTVPLSPLGAVTFFFDPAIACRSAARLAAAVVQTDSLEGAQAVMTGMGVFTELDWERDVPRPTR